MNRIKCRTASQNSYSEAFQTLMKSDDGTRFENLLENPVQYGLIKEAEWKEI